MFCCVCVCVCMIMNETTVLHNFISAIHESVPPSSNMSSTNDQGFWELDEETLNSGACG